MARYPREVTREAARELARMLYADEKKKESNRENAERKNALAQALKNLNTYGWVLCPYTGEYVQTDPSKGRTETINGSLFWINECDGKPVYVNIHLKRHRDVDGTMSYIIDVDYLSEEEMQRWLKGEPIRSVEENRKDESINPDNQNV